jgi:hypothetical protein
MATGKLMPGLSRAQYDAMGAVNWSTLKHLSRSPAHYRAALEWVPDKDSLKVGRAIHLSVFEPEKYGSEVVVWGTEEEQKVRRGKVWDAFAAKHAGKEILTADEAELARNVGRAVRTEATARKYVEGGVGEVSILWSQDGIEMKSRLDFLAHCKAIVDLKTTLDASPEGFAKESWRYRYHVQAALYSDAHHAATGERWPVVLVAAEKSSPWLVQCYRVPEAMLEAGRREYRSLLEQLAWCRSQNEWPGYASAEMDLMAPRWAAHELEEVANG